MSIKAKGIKELEEYVGPRQLERRQETLACG